MRNRAWYQTLKIATAFPHMTTGLAHMAYIEYMLNLCELLKLHDANGLGKRSKSFLSCTIGMRMPMKK